MALSFLAPKVLRVEVTEGVDLESGVILRGDRITVGSGPTDTLRLGAGNVVSEHLTLIRPAGSKNWEYFTSDRGQTAVDKGNSRTGTVRPGMWFRLGNETRVDILRVPAPADMGEEDKTEGKKEVPLTVALPVMAAMLVAFALYLSSFGSTNESSGASLRTAGWFVGATPLEPALDTCLEAGLSPEAASISARVETSAPDALFRAYAGSKGTDPDRAGVIRDELITQVRKLIAETHFLANENRFTEASDILRRLENVLPVGNGNCPILSAARYDLAVLELRGERQ